MTAAFVNPWDAHLTSAEYQIVFYFLGVAVLAFLAGLIRSIGTQREVGSRYRQVVTARLGIMAAALVSYVGLVVAFALTYHPHGAGPATSYRPGEGSILTVSGRYIEWSVAVPLLTIELLTVTGLVGAAQRRVGALSIVVAFGMIFSGYVALVTPDLPDNTARIVWTFVSYAFWAVLMVLLIRAVRHSRRLLTPASWRLLVRASSILLSSFAIYPIMMGIPFFFHGGGWTTTIHISLTMADVVVKLIFGSLILRVAKLRTAEDIRAGDDIHAESIWISSEKVSDAGSAPNVHLADGASVHDRRTEPPHTSAFAAPHTSERPAIDDDY